MRRVLLFLAACLVFAYLGDSAVFALHSRYDTIHVDRFLAFKEKFNKIAYEHTDPREERCVYALAPHEGLRPCWYVSRHRSEIVEVD